MYVWIMPSGVYTKSPEHRAKLSAALKGRKRSTEANQHLSKVLTGRRYNIGSREREVPPPSLEIAWAAGLFEGEGSITMAKRRWGRLSLSLTDKDVLDRFHEAVGVGLMRGPYQQAPGRKPIWEWRLNGEADIRMVMAMFLPWLGARRRARWDQVTQICGYGQPSGYDEAAEPSA